MISKEDLESCVVYTYGSDTLFEWFINQNHIPFDLNYHQFKELYKDFTEEVISLYENKRNDVFFFSGGTIVNNCSKSIVYVDNFKIDINKLNSVIRDKKLKLILNN